MNDVSRSEGRTILYVSHNMNTIRQLCDRCVVLDHGKVVFDGDVEKAIEIYSGIAGSSEAKIDLTKLNRTQNVSKEVEFISAETLNGKKWNIPVGEKLRFAITVKANETLKNVGYRSRVVTGEGISVTVLLAPNLFSCEKGESLTIPLEADVSQLVPGIYYLTPVLYGVNEYGNWQFYDHINNGITLEVENQVGFNENMNWDRRYWGNVKLPEIVDLRSNHS